LPVRRRQLVGSLARRRYRQLALGSQSSSAALRPGASRRAGPRIRSPLDNAAGQGQSGSQHRSAGVAPGGNRRLRLLRMEPVLGYGLLMGGYGYMGGLGGAGAMMGAPYPGARRREEGIADAQRNDDDPHLRSIEAVTGYHIHASDGEIGRSEERR